MTEHCNNEKGSLIKFFKKKKKKKEEAIQMIKSKPTSYILQHRGFNKQTPYIQGSSGNRIPNPSPGQYVSNHDYSLVVAIFR